MKRKEFLSKGFIALGGIAAVSALANPKMGNTSNDYSEDCELSAKETIGPFPNKTPLDYVRENIIGDRNGVPLLVHISILDKSNNCLPLQKVEVDIWHCDSEGRYSEYGGNGLQPEDMTQHHFLRGRQTTNEEGKVSFISIFPGYYPGRAPHIHLEILKDNRSLLATQIAFPDEICSLVYTNKYYGNKSFTSAKSDNLFRNSLGQNMVNSITGDTKDGYVINKEIIVQS